MQQGYRLGINIGVSGNANAMRGVRSLADGFKRSGQNAKAATSPVGAFTRAMNNAGTATGRTGDRLRNARGQVVSMGGGVTQSTKSFFGFGKGLSRVRDDLRRSSEASRGFMSNIFNLKNALIATLAVVTGGAFYNAFIGTNAQFQSQQIGLSSLLQANLDFRDSQGQVIDSSKSFQEAMKLSTSLIRDFESMAVELPGSSDELGGIFSTVFQSARQAGGNLDEIKNLSKLTMGAAKITGIDLVSASRDVREILSGTANVAETALLSRLQGFLPDAATLRSMSQAERLAALIGALNKQVTPEALEAYAKSWEGVTSTFVDFGKRAVRTAGGPLFGLVSNGLAKVNDWLTKNEATVTSVATAFGTNLARGFEIAVSAGKTVVGFFRNQVVPAFNNYALPTILFFRDTFVGAFGLIRDYIRDNQETIKPLLKGLGFLAVGITAITVAAAGFIALGLGTVLVALVEPVIDFNKKLNESFYQFFLWYDGLSNGITRLKNNFLNTFDSIALGFVNMGRSILQTARDIPFLGKAIGFADSRLNATQSLDNLASSLELRMAERGGDVKPEITQNIYTSDPQQAANAANRGITRATQDAIRNSKIGTPITLAPR